MNIQLERIQLWTAESKKLLFSIPNLKFKKGDKILIKGPSGCGKSSRLHLIAGLMLPTEGHVILDTTNLSQISEQQRTLFRRKNIGIVFQRWNLLSHLTVAENLKLTHSTNGADSAESINNFNTQIEIELDKLDLKNRIHSPVSVLSEGEQQRIAVARVLLQKPTLLLADEPTSSLDQANSQIVIEGLLKSAGENTLLVVSHDHRIEKYFTTHIDLAEYK